MDVLGIGAWTAPGAACLVRDGRIVAAAREDAFTRRSEDPEFPRQAIEYCLRAGKIGPSALARIVVSGQELYREPAGRARSLLRRLVGGGGNRGGAATLIAEELAPDVPVETVDAPLAHARAAFRLSGLDEAAIVVLDGARATIARGRGTELEILQPEAEADDAGTLLARARDLTGCRSLAVGGTGAGSDAVIRGVTRAGGFERIWFQSAGAAAAAVGAALGSQEREAAGRPVGPAYNAHQIRTFLRSRDARSEELPRDDVAGAVAPLLEEVARLGWFAGRMAFAERAPASRSILSFPGSAPPDAEVPAADAAPDTVLAVPAGRAAALFDLDERVLSPFAPSGKNPDGPLIFRADREEHRALHALLEAIEAGGRPPVLECRPLARAGEAVGCTPRDAFEAAESRGLGALVMERYVVRPRP